MLHSPIILLGFHRSGTSVLGRIFDLHPEVAYWAEPRHVWMHHFIYRRLDVLTAPDAKPRVIRRIRGEFERFMEEKDRSRFAEKTPSNMVRLPFIRRVFPDCKVIHIIRDGRASTASTLEVLGRPAMGRMIGRRLRQTPWWHYPAYIPKTWRSIVLPRLPSGSIPYWGPRIPGLRQWRKTMTKEEVCAKQWQQTLRIALRDAREYPADQYHEWRYEQLVTEPVRVVREMFDFADLSWRDEIGDWLREHIHTQALHKWREHLTHQQIERIMPHLQPLLGELGYGVD